MVKRKFVTKKRVDEVADFLKESVDWLKKEDCGCCHYNLDNNFAIYVGWAGGYDMDNDYIIKSDTGREVVHNPWKNWVCGYAIECAVKIRNDYDCADYEFTYYPFYNDDSCECWNNGSNLAPNGNYKVDAKDLLSTYVDMVNALNHNKIRVD